MTAKEEGTDFKIEEDKQKRGGRTDLDFTMCLKNLFL